MVISRNVSFALALAATAGCSPGDGSTADNLGGGKSGSAPSGAIFTTTIDGTRVDANIYASKSDVYLDGGPGATAPQKAAALPAGDYYFQVTDPSGHALLSSDDIECRKVHFDGGIITEVYRGASGCLHASGSDQNDGGLTVQLMPYDDTPNPGGEYKVWVTPVDDYDGKFKEKFSKTDNFKVRASSPMPPPPDAGVTPPDAPCDSAAPPPPPPPVDACLDAHT
jgi:hypothetical protein